jgi:uncharacterized protein (TIGR00290 family)
MARHRVLVSWSSGKDSAWMLHELLSAGEVEVDGLLTTVAREDGRIPMHGVTGRLLALQAEAVGLPLREIPIPTPCPDDEWERAVGEALSAARRRGVTAVAFGDLFLQDIRDYRESRLVATGLAALFPLWGRPTEELARRMIAGGLAARITCVDSTQLDSSFAGRAFDAALLDDLPESVDRCGERGEFHTFVHAGPMLSRPLAVEVRDIVRQERFVFAEIAPRDGLAQAGPGCR